MKVATKDQYEKDQEKTEGLIKPSPKQKPPRHDLRNRSTETEKDPDLVRPSADNDPDLSRNYKRVAAWVLDRVARAKRTPYTPPTPRASPEGEHRDGQVWKTENGFAARKDGKTRYDFKSHESARAWVKSKSDDTPKDETKDDEPKVSSNKVEQYLVSEGTDLKSTRENWVQAWAGGSADKILAQAKDRGLSEKDVRDFLLLPQKDPSLSPKDQEALDSAYIFALFNSNLVGGTLSPTDFHAHVKGMPQDSEYVRGLNKLYGEKAVSRWLAQGAGSEESSQIPRPESSPATPENPQTNDAPSTEEKPGAPIEDASVEHLDSSSETLSNWESIRQALGKDFGAFAKSLSLSAEGAIGDVDRDDRETITRVAKALARVDSATDHVSRIKALSSPHVPKEFQDRMLKRALSPATLAREGGDDPSQLMAGIAKHLDDSQLNSLWKDLDSADTPETRKVRSQLFLQSLVAGKEIKGAPKIPPGLTPLVKVLHQQGASKSLLKEDGSFDLQHAIASPAVSQVVGSLSDNDLAEALGGSDGANGPLCDALLGSEMHAAGKTWIRQTLQETLQIHLAWGMPEAMLGKSSKGRDRDQELEGQEREEDREGPEERIANRFNQHFNKTFRKMSERVANRISSADFGWGSDTATKTRQVQNEEARSWLEEMLKAQELGEQQRALLEHAHKSENPWEELQKRNTPPLFTVVAREFAYRAAVLGGGRSHADNLRGQPSQSWGTIMSVSKKGALQVTADLDRLATVFVEEASRLGVPVKIAEDFAKRCDMLADVVEKTAGIVRDADGNLVTAAGEAEEIGAEKPVDAPKGSPEEIALLGDQHENSAVLDMAVEHDLTEAKAIAKAAGLDVVAAKEAPTSVTTLPGLTPAVLRQHINRLVDLQEEIATQKAAIDKQLKSIKNLDDEQKAGVELLKKAAAQLGKNGQFLADSEKGLLQFTAALKSNAPGANQIVAVPDPKNPGEKAGDFFGRISEKLGDEIAAKVQTIWDTTREDLTEWNRVISPFKIVAKTASISDAHLRTAGLADIVVGFKSWLAGESGGIVSRVVGFAGTVKQWVAKRFLFGDQIEKAASELDKAIADARKMTADLLDELDGVKKTAAEEVKEEPCACKKAHGYAL